MAERAFIWPPNLDSQKARSEGRKISAKLAVPSPSLREIEEAAGKLGLKPEIEREKAYPKEWWGVAGRVLVKKSKPKSVILKEVAREIRKMREGRQ